MAEVTTKERNVRVTQVEAYNLTLSEAELSTVFTALSRMNPVSDEEESRLTELRSKINEHLERRGK